MSTSADVAVLPPVNNNHLHHHPSSPPQTESTTKSLKRSRSPSLTRDDPNDSLITIETPTKKSRKRRTTTDIDQSLG